MSVACSKFKIVTQPATEVHFIGDTCDPPHRRTKAERRRWRVKVKCNPRLPHTFTPEGDLVSCPPECPTLTRTFWSCPACGDVVDGSPTCPRDGTPKPAPSTKR